MEGRYNEARKGIRKLVLWSCAAVAVASRPAPAHPQTDSVTVVASDLYGAGSFKQWLLGSTYRDLWSMPIRVPVLDLDSWAGGLTPEEQGGGQQTTSLRMMSADGREWTFRSVDKVPARTRQPDFAGALAGKVIQDQVSSLFPAAPVPASRIARAAGILHPEPVLFVMPDDPALGEFRDLFAGMLGTLEEYANEREDDRPGFGGFTRIAGTDRFLEHIEEEPDNRVDRRGYLAARLVDVLLGDWDRHEDQWRWARLETADGYLWTPIARDRDYAFSDYDGVLMNVVRRVASNAVRFSAGYADLDGLLLNAAPLDRELLTELDRPAWDSVTAAVQASLTDEVIENALRTMPEEFYAARGEEIGRMLQQRRDDLPEAAEQFYRSISRVAEVRLTDESDFALITRYPDGAVDVAVETEGYGPSFHRRFEPDVTREIRIFLREDDDHAVVRGASSPGVRLRIIGGGGADTLADSSTVRALGKWTTLYDQGDETVFVTGSTTSVDRWDRDQGERNVAALVPIAPPDAGTNVAFRPFATYSTTRGIILGGGIEATRYAFRRLPYASQVWLDARVSTRWKDGGLTVGGLFNSPHPGIQLSGEITGTRIDALRFYGFGNETTRDLASELYVVRRDLLEGSVELRWAATEAMSVWGGPIARYARPYLVEGGPLAETLPLGSDGFSAYGITTGLDVDRSDEIDDVAIGAELSGSVFPVATDDASYYADATGDAEIRIPLAQDGLMALTGRAGGRYVWGDYPFYEAAYLGGSHNVRGFPEARFAGDGMVWGGAEASAYLFRLPVGVNWRLSTFVFADAGRVFLRGEDSSTWHTAPGVGLTVRALDFSASVSYAQGPDGRLYFEAGQGF